MGDMKTIYQLSDKAAIGKPGNVWLYRCYNDDWEQKVIVGAGNASYSQSLLTMDGPNFWMNDSRMARGGYEVWPTNVVRKYIFVIEDLMYNELRYGYVRETPPFDHDGYVYIIITHPKRSGDEKKGHGILACKVLYPMFSNWISGLPKMGESVPEPVGPPRSVGDPTVTGGRTPTATITLPHEWLLGFLGAFVRKLKGMWQWLG